MREEAFERARKVLDVDGLGEQPGVAISPSADEAVKLMGEVTPAVVRLALHRPQRPQIALSSDDLFHGGDPKGPEELVLQVDDARVEAERFEPRAHEILPEPRRLEASTDVILRADVVEAGEGDVVPALDEGRDETGDVRHAAHRDDGDPLPVEVVAAPRRHDLDRDQVTQTLDQNDGRRSGRPDDRALDRELCGSRPRMPRGDERRELRLRW